MYENQQKYFISFREKKMKLHLQSAQTNQFAHNNTNFIWAPPYENVQTAKAQIRHYRRAVWSGPGFIFLTCWKLKAVLEILVPVSFKLNITISVVNYTLQNSTEQSS